jgi:hypothetical protein
MCILDVTIIIINYLSCSYIIYKFFSDIETYNVDTKLNKVIVTGNVTTEQVIRVLHKIGKNATPFEDAA